jgi:RNA polymerase sigma-32 factor
MVFSKDKMKMTHDLLSAEEEKNLLDLYKSNKDKSAKDKLVLSNLRLVASIVNRFSDKNELFNEGCCGLIEAIDRFDSTKGQRLSTYATYWIKAYCYDWLLSNHRMVKMPVSTEKKKIFFGLNKARQQLENQGIEPTNYMLAMQMGVTEDDVSEVAVRMKPDVWLDRPIGSAGYGSSDDDVTLGDLLEGGERTEDIIMEMERSKKIKSFMEEFKQALTHNEKIILYERIFKEKKLHEVGDYLGLSRERVRQIEAKLIQKLTTAAHSKHIDKALYE